MLAGVPGWEHDRGSILCLLLILLRGRVSITPKAYTSSIKHTEKHKLELGEARPAGPAALLNARGHDALGGRGETRKVRVSRSPALLTEERESRLSSVMDRELGRDVFRG